MKLFKFFLLSLFLMVAFNKSYAVTDTPFNFLRFISDARAAGLAGNFVAMPNDINGVYYNPATISTIEDKRTSVTFLKHVLDINSGNITYMDTVPGERGFWSAYVGFTNYGSFEEALATGERTGNTFSANNLALGAAYSNELDENLYYGVGLKYIFTNLEQANTSAIAADLGLFYKIPDKRTNIGLSILHIGSQLNQINGVSEALPTDMRLGVNHKLKGLPLLINFSFHHLVDSYDSFFDRFQSFSVAGELYFGKYIQVRAGYDNQVRQLTEPDAESSLTGISGGLGIYLEDFQFNYGLVVYGSAANLHRFSLNFNL